MTEIELKIRFRQAWAEASLVLGVEVQLDHRLVDMGLTVSGFLPHFGGVKGMVIEPVLPPLIETNIAVVNAARATGLYFSFLNAKLYGEFNATRFIEALNDWGYHGSEPKPDWILPR